MNRAAIVDPDTLYTESYQNFKIAQAPLAERDAVRWDIAAECAERARIRREVDASDERAVSPESLDCWGLPRI